MNPIACRELVVSFPGFSEDTARVSDAPPPRARGLTSGINSNKGNILQRTLLWIKGWVQSRMKEASLNRALAPFIKAAKPDSSSVVTPDHLKKLKSALADGAEAHAVLPVAEIVRKNVRSLDLTGLKRLKTSLDSLTPSGTQFEKSLLETVDCSIKDANVTEAKRNLSEALTVFSEWSAEAFDADFVISQIQHNLLTILDLVQPAGDIRVVDRAERPRQIEFESASSVINKQALGTWFNAHSPEQRLRVRTNLWSIAQDLTLIRSEFEADRAMYAFCRSVTKLLWPNDKRHATLYN